MNVFGEKGQQKKKKKHFVFSKDVQINFSVNNQTRTMCLKSVTQDLLIYAPTYLIVLRREHIHKKNYFCVHYITAFVDFCTYYGV